MIANRGISVTNARRTFIFLGNSILVVACYHHHSLLWMLISRFQFIRIASIIPAVFILGASYAGCNEFLVVTLFVISTGAQGLMTVGTMLNPMDLSPVFACTLTGIMNCCGTLTGILAPYVVGLLTSNVSQFSIQTFLMGKHVIQRMSCIIKLFICCRFFMLQSLLTEWRRVFWITVGVHISEAVVFIVWVSGCVQPWNTIEVKKDKESKPLKTVECEKWSSCDL